MTFKRLTALVAFFYVAFFFLSFATEAKAASTSNNVSSPTYFNNLLFQNQWRYSDKFVAESPNAQRGYTWGPTPFVTKEESYKEAPNGKRQVQYFDKGRMELTTGPNDVYTVTSGLLTEELVTGNRQDGDNTYSQLQPSTAQIAGDDNSEGGNADAPTFASFNQVVTLNYGGPNGADDETGQLANLSIDKNGNVTNLLDMPPATVTLGRYEPIFRHNVAQVFVDYQNLKGQVWAASNSITNSSSITNSISSSKTITNSNIFAYQKNYVYTPNPIANVFGYAISEPYWIKTNVAGQPRDVLVQLFQRRVLTYTPSNPDAFKVEMGNIGQAYYQWRYHTTIHTVGDTNGNPTLQSFTLAGIPVVAYIPPTLPGQSQTIKRQVLFAFHGMGGNGSAFAQTALGFAMKNQLILIAPTFYYNPDYKNPEVILHEDLTLTAKINQMVSEFSSLTSVNTKDKYLVYGFSRGAQLAHHYAMFYPKQVLAVAVLSGGAYTLPESTFDDAPLPFPFGVSDLKHYIGQSFDLTNFAKIPFCVEVGALDTNPKEISAAYDPYIGATRLERGEAFSEALHKQNVQVDFTVVPDTAHADNAAMQQVFDNFFQSVLTGSPISNLPSAMS